MIKMYQHDSYWLKAILTVFKNMVKGYDANIHIFLHNTSNYKVKKYIWFNISNLVYKGRHIYIVDWELSWQFFEKQDSTRDIHYKLFSDYGYMLFCAVKIPPKVLKWEGPVGFSHSCPKLSLIVKCNGLIQYFTFLNINRKRNIAQCSLTRAENWQSSLWSTTER